MKNLNQILLLILFVTTIATLHFQRIQIQHHQVDSELERLKQQQANFQTSINTLINNLTEISNQVNQQQNKSQKIALLENAIVSERETIFELSNSIVPPFNMSKNACNQLTNDQKINILDQVSKIKQQLSQFKLTAASLPQNDQLNMINRDINKQTILVDSIQKIAYTKCQGSIILSPTIFQSNIYASNWILGNQTIDDLIEEYYQRSIQYNNVTNCPLQFPFFNGQQCINCTGDQEVFNMYTKQCDSCPPDSQLNVALRVCKNVPHYSDFTKTNNYNLDGASQLPKPDPNLTPCPAETPFYNGTCINCNRGFWWSVRQSKCKTCEKGLAFDKNLKECIKPTNNTLTILQGTKWVTGVGNSTKVLQERADLISKSNLSTLSYCAEDTPYYDGILCISCEQQFNLNTHKCTSPQDGTVYDDNLHAYVTPDTNRQTDPKAANLLISSPLKSSTLPVCNASNPYFDGIACIKCPQPFILFNVDTKKCQACAAQQIYNTSTQKCQKRGVIKISSNFNRLQGTPTKSIEAYKAELLNLIQNNNEFLIQKCSNDQYYSNYTNCFPCKSNEYFNVETKKCGICNGTFNTTTSICTPLKVYLTNLNTTQNLILGSNNLSYYQKLQAGINGPTDYCQSTQPYASDSKCISCNGTTPYFNLQTSKCVACSANQIYYNVTRQCVKPIQVSNIDALLQADNVFQKGNYTLANLKKNISSQGPNIPCSRQTPAFNGVSCFGCNQTTFYSLQTNTCITGKIVSNITELKLRNNVKQTDNYTLANIQNIINNRSMNIPQIQCKNSKPLQVKSKCINCDQFQLFDLKNGNCIQPTFYSNTTALKSLNVFQSNNYTLANLQANNLKLASPKKPCPVDKPLYNNKECIGCTNKTIYNLQGLNCINATQITNIDALLKNDYLQTTNVTLKSFNETVSHTPPPIKKCDEKTPLFNGHDCISCPNAIYNLSSLSCSTCSVQTYYNSTTHRCELKPTNYPNLNNNNWTVNERNGVLNVIAQVNAKKNISGSAPCPIQTPFYNNKTLSCLSCPAGSYYNYDSLVCGQCPNNQQIDENTHECKAKLSEGLYQTSLNNSNLLYGGLPLAQHQQNYNNNKTTYPKIQDCPNATPYYDGYQCIKCFDFTPYFNLVTRLCQNCPQNSVYNHELKDCLTQNEVVTTSPNIAKMYSTIFG